MRHICFLALLLWTAPSLPAFSTRAPISRFTFPQTDDAIKWAFTAVRSSDGAYELHLTATLGEGWHTYSQETPSGGPVPTAIAFTSNPLLSLQGAVREDGKLNKHFEPLFGVSVMQYSTRVDFVQKIILRHPVKTTVKGRVRYMVCNDHECLPPASKEFEVPLPQ